MKTGICISVLLLFLAGCQSTQSSKEIVGLQKAARADLAAKQCASTGRYGSAKQLKTAARLSMAESKKIGGDANKAFAVYLKEYNQFKLLEKQKGLIAACDSIMR